MAEATAAAASAEETWAGRIAEAVTSAAPIARAAETASAIGRSAEAEAVREMAVRFPGPIGAAARRGRLVRVARQASAAVAEGSVVAEAAVAEADGADERLAERRIEEKRPCEQIHRMACAGRQELRWRRRWAAGWRFWLLARNHPRVPDD